MKSTGATLSSSEGARADTPPASGKSTLGVALESAVLQLGKRAFRLDGDNIRMGLNKDLGFSEKDRNENIRRIGEVAKLFAASSTLAITAFISPYIADRDTARKLHEEAGLVFIEVFVDACVLRRGSTSLRACLVLAALARRLRSGLTHAQTARRGREARSERTVRQGARRHDPQCAVIARSSLTAQTSPASQRPTRRRPSPRSTSAPTRARSTTASSRWSPTCVCTRCGAH